MTFWFVLLAVTTTVASLPVWLPPIAGRLAGRKTFTAPAWMSLIAAILFAGAFWLPDIHISPETQTFQQHFVGGGLFCATLYAYGRRLLGLRLTWWQDLAVLLAVISTLGVTAELGEFALTRLGFARIGTGDTDWDLLANTAGAVTGWVVLWGAGYHGRRRLESRA